MSIRREMLVSNMSNVNEAYVRFTDLGHTYKWFVCDFNFSKMELLDCNHRFFKGNLCLVT